MAPAALASLGSLWFSSSSEGNKKTTCWWLSYSNIPRGEFKRMGLLQYTEHVLPPQKDFLFFFPLTYCLTFIYVPFLPETVEITADNAHKKWKRKADIWNNVLFLLNRTDSLFPLGGKTPKREIDNIFIFQTKHCESLGRWKLSESPLEFSVLFKQP